MLSGNGQSKPAFQELRQLWEFKDPQPNVGSFRSGSVLDAVFTTNQVAGWEASASILNRAGNNPATTRTFSDTSTTTDHRPLMLIVESDSEERLEGLREAIADMRAVLARMEAELARMEAGD